MTASLLRFARQSESRLVPLQLASDQRLPLSTEILESSFGLFKQLERQHSKGGFTCLLAAYDCLLHASTPESIRRDFRAVSVKQMKAWVTDNLGQTLASKRQSPNRLPRVPQRRLTFNKTIHTKYRIAAWGSLFTIPPRLENGYRIIFRYLAVGKNERCGMNTFGNVETTFLNQCQRLFDDFFSEVCFRLILGVEGAFEPLSADAKYKVKMTEPFLPKECHICFSDRIGLPTET